MLLEHTLLLPRKIVADLLNIRECMDAVEHAFALYAQGKTIPPKLLGIHADNGGFHIKAGIMELSRPYFVAKMNANFPGNPKQNGLPTIQGVIIVCDAANGRLLALMDSAALTILRTGAATGVAAKYLSLKHASVATICGCGNQGIISLQALMEVRDLTKVYAFDIDEAQAEKLQQQFEKKIEIIPVCFNDLPAALAQSQVIVTCTPSTQPFIHARDVMPGTFIAAVGADSEHKQELFPELVAASKVVADITEQSITIGEVHHAINKNLMTREDVYAELGSVITGEKPGRESDEEIIIFDSTGTALQDVASAAIVYERALQQNSAMKLNFLEE